MIPKIIHYCWFGPKSMPKTIRKCIATWHKNMPDYEFRLWNEENSPMEYPFVRSAYAAKKYAFVADYVRFWALHQYGGIYLDTDMYVVRSFTPLLNAEFFSAWETPLSPAGNEEEASASTLISCGALGACALGACALGEVTKAILDKYDTLRFDVDNLQQLIIPRVITPILLAYQDKIAIHPYDSFYPFPFTQRNQRDFLHYATENTYAIHLWEISWYPWYKKIVRELVIFIKKMIHR